MSRLLLIHWNADEAEERAKKLRQAGHEVRCHCKQQGEGLREIRKDPPEAAIIDLSRLPSHGTAVATWLRQQRATRSVPVVFVEGDPVKTEKVRKALPDAVFTPWSRIRGTVRQAIQSPPDKPIVPDTMAGYAGTPLPKKLGIKNGTVLTLLGAPHDFEKTLGKLPDRVRIRWQARGTANVILLFTKKQSELTRRFPGATRCLEAGGRIWIVWPKKTSGVKSDLSQPSVRAFGLKAGFVDFKISAFDETWSGLCFVRRKR